MFKNTKLVTHKGCLDGSGCAILWRALGGRAEDIIFTSPGGPVDEVAKDLFHRFDGKVIFADIAVEKSTADLLNARKNDFLILDHHKTSLPLVGFDWCEIEIENKRCGSQMFYDWLAEEEMLDPTFRTLIGYDKLIMLIDDYDRWQKLYSGTAEVAQLHGCLGQEMFIDRFVDHPKTDLLPEERYLLTVDTKRKEGFIKRKKKDCQMVNQVIDGKDCRVAYVVVDIYQNDVAEAIYSDSEMNVDLVVMINPEKVSFRAPDRNVIDCSKIASLQGGGGHLKAAGVRMERLLGTTLLETVIGHLKLNP